MIYHAVCEAFYSEYVRTPNTKFLIVKMARERLKKDYDIKTTIALDNFLNSVFSNESNMSKSLIQIPYKKLQSLI